MSFNAVTKHPLAAFIGETPIDSFKPRERLPPGPHENVAQDRLSGYGDVLVVDTLDVLGVVGDPVVFGNRDADSGRNSVSSHETIDHLVWPHVFEHVSEDHKLCGIGGKVFLPRLGVSDVKHLVNEIGAVHTIIKCVKINIDDTIRIR